MRIRTIRYACVLLAGSGFAAWTGCGETAETDDDSTVDPATPMDGGASSMDSACLELGACCATLDGADQVACEAIAATGSACSETLLGYRSEGACGGEAPLEMSTLFGPCQDDSQCPGAGAVCRKADTGYPQGYCTLPCPGGDRGPCDLEGIFHHCAQDRAGEYWCERRCQNGFDCGRSHYTCEGAQLGEGGICVGVCSSDADCGGGAECNAYSGECLPAGSVPSEGSVIGGECSANADCLSNDCNPARSGANPTGWVDGYCFGTCILPQGYTTSSFWTGDELPTGTCPESDVCFPNGGYAEGDQGLCLAGCTSDGDCRTEDGYFCRTSIALRSGTRNYTRGVCWPNTNCQTTPCPDGLTCETVATSSGTAYVCSRN